jgi:hypothetical protein
MDHPEKITVEGRKPLPNLIISALLVALAIGSFAL